MIDKAKLGFWEVFTYFLIGLVLTITSVGYLLFLDYIVWKSIVNLIKESGAIGVVFFPLLLLVFGMVFEPISNLLLKLLEKLPFLKPRKSRGVEALVPFIKPHLPNDLGLKQRFRYCKAVIEQNYPQSNLSVFLARFGFYRSMGILMLVLYPITLSIIDITCTSFLFASVFLLLALIFIKRAQFFKGHMEYEVYYNFLAYRENIIFKGSQQGATS